jgi:dienelactone hydrolase
MRCSGKAPRTACAARDIGGMKITTLLLSSFFAATLSSTSFAAVKGETVSYQAGSVASEGFLAFDDANSSPRPGVLVIHDWMGVSDHTRGVCEDLAKMGYVAFAPDIYGKGIRPPDPKAASAEAGKYKADRALLRERARAGLDQLANHKLVQKDRIAAIGYCFGGTTAIELARSGAEIAGVVAFHASLDAPNPADGKNIKAKLLVLHGADDPFVKKEDIAAFQEELRAAGVDWQMVYYGNAVHSFTQKKAGTDKSKGAAYEERAARRSWEAMKDFFAEIFGQSK